MLVKSMNIYEPTPTHRKVFTNILRGGNAEKSNFYWVIALSKYGCEVLEWFSGFTKKYFRFHFGH